MPALPPAPPALSLAQPPPAQSALAGDWKIHGPAPARGRAPELGELKVDGAGNFQWLEQGRLQGLGQLQPLRPSGGARAGQDCWRVQRGKGDLYVFLEGATLEVYDAASHTQVGTAAKSGARRR